VKLSHPVVEAGLYDAKAGAALVLANFTYKPIKGLKITVRIPNPRKPVSVKSVESGSLKFTSAGPGSVSSLPQYSHTVTFTVDLGLTDIILIE